MFWVSPSKIYISWNILCVIPLGVYLIIKYWTIIAFRMTALLYWIKQKFPEVLWTKYDETIIETKWCPITLVIIIKNSLDIFG